jgi:hypothetical protein
MIGYDFNMSSQGTGQSALGIGYREDARYSDRGLKIDESEMNVLSSEVDFLLTMTVTPYRYLWKEVENSNLAFLLKKGNSVEMQVKISIVVPKQSD